MPRTPVVDCAEIRCYGEVHPADTPCGPIGNDENDASRDAGTQFSNAAHAGCTRAWLSKSRRRIWVAAIVTLSIVASPFVWWALQLIGLPDIGDPFDVAAFDALTIPDERNAFVLYTRAANLLVARPNTIPLNTRVGGLTRWSQATPETRRWTEDNRDALAVYLRGAERPDALDRARRREQ